MSPFKVIVPGGLNTDIIGDGVDRILGAGELTLGGNFKVGPGGKARNMAQMAAVYLGPDKVAMIGRSSRDPFGFWRLPVESLQRAGVDTTHVKLPDFEAAGKKFPGIALIPVDKTGRNQIYVLPGVNDDFSPEDLDDARALFDNPTGDKMLMMALEIPHQTARYAIELANRQGIRVVLDPGGISQPLDEVLQLKIFLLKPNEHEAEIMTGIHITDFKSAGKAAEVLLSRNVENVLITHGARGGYLFNRDLRLHIPIPELPDTGTRDETGCGDQVTAVLTAGLAEGKDLPAAACMAILAGSLQFFRSGIQPVSRPELEKYARKLST